MCDLWDLVSTFQGDAWFSPRGQALCLAGSASFWKVEVSGWACGKARRGCCGPPTPNRLWEDRAGRAGQVAQWLDTFQGQALLFPLEARLVPSPAPCQHWDGELGFGEEAVPRGGGRCSPSARVVGLPGL